MHAGQIGHVVLTHNLPVDAVVAPAAGWPFRFTELFNAAPAGFGTNHNQAFRHCDTELFCILNPDIELSDPAVWLKMVECVRQPGVGCAYPVLYNGDGSRQENEREAVTPAALLRRHLLNSPQRTEPWLFFRPSTGTDMELPCWALAAIAAVIATAIDRPNFMNRITRPSRSLT